MMIISWVTFSLALWGKREMVWDGCDQCSPHDGGGTCGRWAWKAKFTRKGRRGGRDDEDRKILKSWKLKERTTVISRRKQPEEWEWEGREGWQVCRGCEGGNRRGRGCVIPGGKQREEGNGTAWARRKSRESGIEMMSLCREKSLVPWLFLFPPQTLYWWAELSQLSPRCHLHRVESGQSCTPTLWKRNRTFPETTVTP